MRPQSICVSNIESSPRPCEIGEDKREFFEPTQEDFAALSCDGAPNSSMQQPQAGDDEENKTPSSSAPTKQVEFFTSLLGLLFFIA